MELIDFFFTFFYQDYNQIVISLVELYLSYTILYLVLQLSQTHPMGAELQSNNKRKIHFIIQKKVDFGKALYVVGNIPELGSWALEAPLKLCWAKDDYWTGFISIPLQILEKPIEYKYVIANWDHPQQGKVQWEAGSTNRMIQAGAEQQHIICQNIWNMEKITLNLIVPDEGKNQEYSVIGDCKELGNWKRSFKMRLKTKKNPFFLENLKLIDNQKKYRVYSLSFQIFRAKPKIHYYYIKRTHSCEVQRHPGRKYQLQSKFNSHPKCLKICHPRGDTQMYQICNFKQLNYSTITDNILLGPYLGTPEDFKVLKNEGVTSILSIQTDQDLASHKLTSDYLQKLSKQNSIELCTYAIQDMNKKDFLTKCIGAIQLLKKLVESKKKVYVHCSAGVYRSPQIVALYLIITKHFTPEEAVQYVKSRHPFARPNTQTVSYALEFLCRSNKLQSFSSQS